MKTWTPLIVTSRAEPWAGHHTARGPKCRLRLLFPSCLSQDFPLNTTFKLFKNRKHFSNLYGKKQQKPGSITYSSPRLSLSQGLYSSCVAHITSSSCERNTQTRFTADSPTAQSQDKTCTSSLGSDGHLSWIPVRDGAWRSHSGAGRAQVGGLRKPRTEHWGCRVGLRAARLVARGGLSRRWGRVCGQLTSALCRSPRSVGRAAPPPCPTAPGSSTASRGSPRAAVRTPGPAAPSPCLQEGSNGLAIQGPSTEPKACTQDTPTCIPRPKMGRQSISPNRT